MILFFCKSTSSALFSMDSMYQEGFILVHLWELKPDNLECHADVQTSLVDSLRQSGHVISGRVTSECRDNILRHLNYSPKQFHATLDSASPPSIEGHQIFCAASSADLKAARRTLGPDFICNVRLYCIPGRSSTLYNTALYLQELVQPRKLSDGVIFRNVRYYMADIWSESRVAVAQVRCFLE